MLEEGERVVRRVAVLGSSLGVIVRPKGEGPPYPRLLERMLNDGATGEVWLVENLCEIAGIADDLAGPAATAMALYPDVIVLHFGHVEALRRPHSRRAWRWAHMGSPALSPRRRFLRKSLFRRYSSLRRGLRLRVQWSSLPRFERALAHALTDLRTETAAQLILVEATPITPRIERYAPGSAPEVARYNDALRRLATTHGAELLTMEELYRRDAELRDPEQLTPDGSHYSARAHAVFAAALAERIDALTRVSTL